MTGKLSLKIMGRMVLQKADLLPSNRKYVIIALSASEEKPVQVLSSPA
jgi:hypothetical protein